MSIHVLDATCRLRLVLDAPHGNAITDAMVTDLRAALASVHRRRPPVKLVTIEAEGADFCFGASLPEHAPERIPDVLPRFHALIGDLLAVPAVTVAAISGRCLGGGFEIALACDVIIAADDAVMGLPEIAVGAFPPVGSILLPLKIGAARAAASLLTGTPRPVADWRHAGLVEQVVPPGELAAVAHRCFLLTIARHSAASLARAAIASRLVVQRAVDELLPVAERLYLDDLLATADAAEGVAAFLEKRPPQWKDS